MSQRMYLDIGGAFPMDAMPGQLPLTNRQEATVIAGLRLLQMLLRGQVDFAGPVERERAIQAAATDFGLHDPLTPDEIDQLLADCFREVA